MPLEQTITVINNSGKIISSGKQLLSIFKEAKASYQDKKAEIKAERSSIARAHTFDLSRTQSYRGHQNSRQQQPQHHHHHYLDEPRHHYYDDEPEPYSRSRPPVSKHGRRLDEQSEASTQLAAKPRRSRSVGGRSSSSYSHSQWSSSTRPSHYPDGRELRRGRSKPALTESNLKTLSEVSSHTPGKAPAAYRSPYAETIPLDAVMSKMDITHAELRHYAQTRSGNATPPERRGTRSAAISRRQSVDSGFSQHSERSSAKEIDMDLAYGNVPPDLEDRVDLDPAYQEARRKERAQALVRKVESLLDEAHCVQHGASAVISNLQKSPEKAASVALTLAELSSAVRKMSPAFLGLLKGGSPVVFSLLASPQFLIGTSIAVGVTVVMFGGWKIVKRVKEQKAAREAMAFASDGPYYPSDRPLPLRTQTESEVSMGVDEALELDDELSTIETWRRGIMPYGADNESADYELITPEARRANKERHSRDDVDVQSRRSAKTGSSDRKKKKKNPGANSGSSSSSSKGDPRDGSRRPVSSVAGSSSGKKSGKSKTKTIDDGTRSRLADEEAGSMTRSRDRDARHGNMLKAVLKKPQKERSEIMIV